MSSANDAEFAYQLERSEGDSIAALLAASGRCVATMIQPKALGNGQITWHNTLHDKSENG